MFLGPHSNMRRAVGQPVAYLDTKNSCSRRKTIGSHEPVVLRSVFAIIVR